MHKSLLSDTMAPVLPEVVEALVAANHGEAMSYGYDVFTERAVERFRVLFGRPVAVHWAFGGTGSNLLALSTIVGPSEGIICAESAHIVVYECGAIHRFSGAQLLTVPTLDGKLRPGDLEWHLSAIDDTHRSRPRVLSITQATETGLVYSLDEVHELTSIAHHHDMYVHVDGARIGNALVALDASVEEGLVDTGVDVVSFGGTKAGMFYGEAVVFVNPELADNARRVQVSIAQLGSKTRYIAAQFEALLADDLWLRTARHANEMAALLAKQLDGMTGVEVLPTEANMVFVRLAPAVEHALVTANPDFFLYSPTQHLARWVTAFDTTTADVDHVVDMVNTAATSVG